MKINWNKTGFVIASKSRSSVVQLLAKGPSTPKAISEETGLYLSHVSNALKELTKEEIVTCLTPDLRKGRLYSLTDIGKTIAEQIKK